MNKRVWWSGFCMNLLRVLVIWFWICIIDCIRRFCCFLLVSDKCDKCWGSISIDLISDKLRMKIMIVGMGVRNFLRFFGMNRSG